jgi:cytochrome P460
MSMNRMRTSVVVLSLVYAAALALSVSAQQPPRDGPRYQDGTSLVRPADYREWSFLGSGLGLNYEPANPRADAAPTFTNVFVNPSSYRGFMQTGTWPNETVFVLEFRRSQTNAAPNLNGRFQGELTGIEAEVKDMRFPDGWAFYNFGQANALRATTAPLSGDAVASCVECHTKNTAVERTFVQFYPTLLEVARQKRTLKPGF